MKIMTFLSVSPISVEITNHTKPVKIGEQRTLGCEVTGSKPIPDISWLVDQNMVEEIKTNVRKYFIEYPKRGSKI